jgi:hypothetical protein
MAGPGQWNRVGRPDSGHLRCTAQPLIAGALFTGLIYFWLSAMIISAFYAEIRPSISAGVAIVLGFSPIPFGAAAWSDCQLYCQRRGL